jgi:O-antigen/teichoic acid export membrane protein
MPSVIGQTLMTFSGTSASYVVAIITGIVVARTLGPAGKGVASYAALVLTLFTQFGDGLQNGILHECGHRGKEQIFVYGTAMRLLGLWMVPAAGLMAVVAIVFPRHAALAFVACAVPFAVYVQVANSVFFLHNDIRTTVIAGLIPTLGVALLTIPALTIFHGGLTAVLAIWAAMFAGAAVYAMIRLNAYMPPLLFASNRALIREQGWFSVKTGLTSLVGFLNLRIDVFVVSIMLDARTLGIYVLAVASGEMMWQVSRPLIWSTNGRIATASRERAIALSNAVTRNVLAVEFLLGIVIFALAPFAVKLVYGSAYAESGAVVRWLLPGLVLYASQAPLGYYLTIKEGKPAAMLAIQSISVVLCAGITVFTIGRLNVFGAALATTVTYVCATIASSALYARYTDVPFAQFTFLQREDFIRFRRMLERVLPPRRPLADLGAES